MKISTLSIACVASALCVGAFMPETAWAKVKVKDRRPSCDQFSSIQCAASPGTYRHSNYSNKPMSDADMRSFYEGLGMLCNLGGGAMTAVSAAAAIGIGGAALASVAAGPVGWGVGGLCLLQQLVGLGLPPPRPIYAKGRDQNVVINIDMNDPKVLEFFKKNPGVLQKLQQQAPTQPAPPKGADVPVAKAPENPEKKAAEATVPTPAPAPQPVPAKAQATAPVKESPSAPKAVPAASKPLEKATPVDPPTKQREAEVLVPHQIINAKSP